MGQLLGGEQRRVAIARALINSPELILADEPTADLDNETEREILDLLVEIHRADRMTLVIVTHNDLIASAADSVLRMDRGRASLVMAPQIEFGEIVSVEKIESHVIEIQTETPPTIAASKQETDPVAEPVRLGEGLERFAGRFVLWAAPILVLGYALNWGFARYQQSRIEQRIAARAALEEFAMSGLRRRAGSDLRSQRQLRADDLPAQHDRRPADLCDGADAAGLCSGRHELDRSADAYGRGRAGTGAENHGSAGL
jgi:putative ABC transport system ATP-binding protein/macrolide transport system ATP-binding/permease protein/lipoprotein-releasing system ATP-binding protein